MTALARCILVSIVVLGLGCLQGRFRGDDDERVLPPVDVSHAIDLPDGGAGVVSKDPPSLDPSVVDEPPYDPPTGGATHLPVVAPPMDGDRAPEHDCPE